MAGLALYRKYRPKSFDELFGQDYVVETLKKTVEKSQPAHAYLFVGSRGVGKTTAARIFARDLGVSGKDIYELDAASNRKIDDFRELNESVHSLPFESKYKVYIIDEVHMLTKEAFNAFLKTLEEPPEYVIFILATTEAEKLPDTIKSRCQILDFNKADYKSISSTIKYIAKREGVEVDEDAIRMLTVVADGSFRDAVGAFQKALMLSVKQNITIQDVQNATQIAPVELVLSFLEALGSKDYSKLSQINSDLRNLNINVELFLRILLNILRQVLVLRYNSEKQAKLEEDYGLEVVKRMLVLSKNTVRINSKLLLDLIEIMEKISFINDRTLLLDLLIFKRLESE